MNIFFTQVWTINLLVHKPTLYPKFGQLSFVKTKKKLQTDKGVKNGIRNIENYCIFFQKQSQLHEENVLKNYISIFHLMKFCATVNGKKIAFCNFWENFVVVVNYGTFSV